MPPERSYSLPESEGASEQKFESATALGARLVELGWTEEQLGKFTTAMQTMADAMGTGINFELAVSQDQDGDEVAEVTLLGEGKGLGPEQIAELIDKNEFPVELLTEASTQFFADQNKVILRRKRNRAVEVDSAEPVV